LEGFFALRQKIITNDDQRHTSRTEFLLGSGIDQGKLPIIQSPRRDIRRHIGYHRNIAGIRKLLELGPFDGVVRADMEIGHL
jgi:hypothetical protein